MTVQRFKFNSRSREEEESVATFVAELRHLAIHCEFGEVLNDMLRDQLICGINDKRILRRLLSEREVDLSKLWRSHRLWRPLTKMLATCKV